MSLFVLTLLVRFGSFPLKSFANCIDSAIRKKRKPRRNMKGKEQQWHLTEALLVAIAKKCQL
jgi:hypothetical protein